MELIDLTKQTINRMLPKRHQIMLAGLFSGLLVLVILTTHNGALSDTTEKQDTNQAPQDTTVAEASSPANQGTPDLTASNPGSPGSSQQPADSSLPQSAPRLYLEVESGDNLSTLFDRAGLAPQQVYLISNSSPDASKLAELYPGYRLGFEIDQEQTLQSLEVIKSPIESYLFTRDAQGGYTFELIAKEPQTDQVYKEAVITDSLFQAAQRGDIPAALAMELASIFGGVIDFILDTREGDSFNIIYEENSLDGEYIGFGKILATQFTNQGETYTAIRYENANGEANFYNLEGESMRKAFLLNPVDFTRISSGFNLSRKHPILNTIRAHKGTDYAAPTGTPVVATADGKVTFANRKGTFGKLVVIQHGDNFETKYAHLNEYARGISNGVRVKQGQVIGYVGSTGGATGPHLHYEFLMDGVHRNSRTIYDLLPRADSIAATEMQRFKQQTQGLISLLASKGQTANTLAQHTPSTKK